MGSVSAEKAGLQSAKLQGVYEVLNVPGPQGEA